MTKLSTPLERYSLDNVTGDFTPAGVWKEGAGSTVVKICRRTAWAPTIFHISVRARMEFGQVVMRNPDAAMQMTRGVREEFASTEEHLD